jgi:prophage antirepressor-like protein
MSNDISNSNNAMVKVFESEQFGNVRIISDGDKYLFCGADVANALGYSKSRNAIARHCRGALKRGIPTTSGVQEMTFIPEGDVYRLITHSKLPTAEKFESWVFDEVLPTLRRTGSYTMQDVIFEKFPQTPKDYRSALLALVDQIDINETLTKENKILSGEKLTWDNSSILVALIRKYASVACNGMFGAGWKAFYKELLYKHGINLESRKTKDCNKNPKNLNRAVYKYLADDEWQGAIETAVAMCVSKDIDISSIIKENVTDTELAVC